MKQYIIELTDVQYKALSYVAVFPDEWIKNAVTARCIDAINEIVHIEIENKLNSGETISGTKEDIVLNSSLESAFDRANKSL